MASYLETRYLAPTNTRGARIKVIGAGSRITLATFPFNYRAGDAHLFAAEAVRHGFKIEKAFATKHGFVFRATMAGE